MQSIKKIPLFLSKKEIDTFLKVIRRDRHRVAFTLMAYSGLRVSEVCGLKVKDINLARRYMRVFGKGSKERLVPLSSNLQKLIEQYLQKYGNHLMPESFLVGGNRRSWHDICKKYARKSLTRSDIHCHTLRHSFATNLYEEGVQIERISQLLGHSRLDTTMIYAHISVEQKRDAIMVLDNSRFRFVRKITTICRTVTEITVQPWEERNTSALIGRESEQKELASYLERKISVLILGPKGTGKSALLRAVSSFGHPSPEGRRDVDEGFSNIIHLPEFKKKQSLIKIILTSRNIDSPEVYTESERILKKLPIDDLLNEITDLNRIVIIDDITDLSRADKKLVARLSQKTLVVSSSSRSADRKLFETYMEIKPLKRHYTRTILSDMIQMTDPTKKEQTVNDILHAAGDNLKEAEYIARQMQLGKATEEITTDERAANQVSIAPVLTMVMLFFAAWILKSYAAGMVAFSYAVLVVFRMVFYRYIFTPAISKRKA